MRVVNVSGIPFSKKYNGEIIVIPFNNMAYDVPDDFGIHGELRVIIPPKPVDVSTDEAIVNITDDDLQNAKDNVKVKSKKRLKGVKIKKTRRQAILSSKKKKTRQKD